MSNAQDGSGPSQSSLTDCVHKLGKRDAPTDVRRLCPSRPRTNVRSAHAPQGSETQEQGSGRGQFSTRPSDLDFLPVPSNARWRSHRNRRDVVKGPMPLRNDVRLRRDVLHQIATRHGALNLRLFGSVARGEERPDSDIDLLIDLADDRGFGDYLALAPRSSKPCCTARSILCWHAASARTSGPTSKPRPHRCEIRSSLLAHIADAIAAIETYVAGGRETSKTRWCGTSRSSAKPPVVCLPPFAMQMMSLGPRSSHSATGSSTATGA
jgi:hypothetical protein